MNVYDFDETILEGDSEIYFFKYVLDTIPESNIEKDKLPNCTKDEKYKLLLKYIDNLDDFLEIYWDNHQQYVKEWYLKAHKDDDVVVSATPEFILIPIMKRLHINNLIATKFDTKTCKTIGKPCYKEEKVIRFKGIYKDVIPDNFYSDSDTDVYMAKISKNAYKVIHDKIIPWRH